MIYFLLVTLLSTLILFIACTNILPFSLSIKYKCIIFFFILLCTLILCPLIRQAATPITLTGVLIIILLIDSRRMLNICCALFGYALSIVVNYMLALFIEYTFKISYAYIEEHLTLLFSTVFAILIFLITYFIKWLLWKKAKLQDLRISKQILLFVSLNLIVSVIIFIFNFISSEALGYPPKTVYFNGILFTTYFIFTTILLFFVVQSITKEEKMKSKLSQYQNLQEYTRKIEKLYMELRTFKHDYVNILSTMSCYIENQDMIGLKKYFTDEIKPLSESFDQTNTKLGLLSNIKILELKSLLYAKMIYAITNRIDVYLDVAEPIEFIAMKTVDLARVLAIFLDNAIESSIESNEKKLEIGIINKDESILIIVKNSCIHEHVHMNKIYDSGYSTKGVNRGIGLFSAKQVMGHYDNIIHSTSLKDNLFTQQIEILD